MVHWLQIQWVINTFCNSRKIRHRKRGGPLGAGRGARSVLKIPPEQAQIERLNQAFFIDPSVFRPTISVGKRIA